MMHNQPLHSTLLFNSSPQEIYSVSRVIPSVARAMQSVTCGIKRILQRIQSVTCGIKSIIQAIQSVTRGIQCIIQRIQCITREIFFVSRADFSEMHPTQNGIVLISTPALPRGGRSTGGGGSPHPPAPSPKGEGEDAGWPKAGGGHPPPPFRHPRQRGRGFNNSTMSTIQQFNNSTNKQINKQLWNI
jgi:hypothetical protein